MMTRRSCAIYGVGIVCAHLLIIGIGLVVAQVFQTLIHNRLKKEITLTEGSRVFETWKNPPPPVFMQFFFFNISNPDEFLAGSKPVVSQVGPYTYRIYQRSIWTAAGMLSDTESQREADSYTSRRYSSFQHHGTAQPLA